MSDFLKFRCSGSTVMAITTLVALTAAYHGGSYIPEQFLGVIILLVLPTTAAIAVLWSAANFVRRRALQYAIEFGAGVVVLLAFYYHVIRSPI